MLYLLKHCLYRDQVRVLNVHKAGEPVIPATYNVEQRDGRKTCLKQWQHNLEEYPPVTSAVDLGGLKQCIRDGGLYERPKDYDVIRADQTGQQEYPNGVIDVQVLHIQYVGRNQTAAEQHRKEQYPCEELAMLEMRLRQHISVKAHYRKAHHRAHYSVENGDPIRRPHLIAHLEQVLVAFQRPLGREEREAIVRYRGVGRKRYDEYQHHRYYHQQ